MRKISLGSIGKMAVFFAFIVTPIFGGASVSFGLGRGDTLYKDGKKAGVVMSVQGNNLSYRRIDGFQTDLLTQYMSDLGLTTAPKKNPQDMSATKRAEPATPAVSAAPAVKATPAVLGKPQEKSKPAAANIPAAITSHQWASAPNKFYPAWPDVSDKHHSSVGRASIVTAPGINVGTSSLPGTPSDWQGWTVGNTGVPVLGYAGNSAVNAKPVAVATNPIAVNWSDIRENNKVNTSLLDGTALRDYFNEDSNVVGY